MAISDKAEVRVAPGGILDLDPSAKIDDDVRIVISESGRLKIGPHSKIGKGTIINCGGVIEIGESVAVYGYCYLQSSIWEQTPDGRVYDHGRIVIGDHAVISPYCLLSHSAEVAAHRIVAPHSTVGKWMT